jgi:hypothetical protein
MKERLPIDRMPGLLRQPDPSVPLGLYVHGKSGKSYVVVGGTFLATGDDQIIHVQYISVENGYSAHRTVADFLEPQPLGGDTNMFEPRFRFVQSLDGFHVFAILVRVMLHNLGRLVPWFAPDR